MITLSLTSDDSEYVPYFIALIFMIEMQKGSFQSSIHHKRAVRIGHAISILREHDIVFNSYKSFLDLAGTVIGKDAATVKRSLQKVGLWVPGKRGRPGGSNLQTMLWRIELHANLSGEGDTNHD